MRLEGKLNEIWVKHLNRVSEVETAGYIWDNLYYGLRKSLQEVIHATFDNPLNDFMALMWVARKAEGEHEQESIAPPVLLNQVLLVMPHLTKKEILILTLRLLLRSPGQNGLKCNSSWWWLLKGLKVHWKTRFSTNRNLIRVREGTVKVPVSTARDPNSNVTTKTVMWPKIIKLRPGGNDWNHIQCYNCQGWGHMQHECSNAWNARPLNFQVRHNRTSPKHLGQTWYLSQCQCQTPANEHSSQSSIS